MSDRLTDDEMMKMVREQADELESCAAAMRAAGAEIDRLRLALETATRERDDIAAWAESWMKRVAAAERERDEARVALEKSRRTIYFTWRDVEACREGLSISADIKGDTLEEVVRFLLNERDDIATFIESASDAHARAAAAERERDEARQEAKRLMSLTQNWYEGRARIGAHMTFVDQRFYDSVRLQRTGWPGDDADGDGGPPEE